MPALSPYPRSREIRVGLVMYGGVSLAVYINGVAAEFFNAVRGRGVYKLLKAMTDSDIIVDVVSGTSAGGINGVLLSYALCNGLDFHKTADLWREAGDIARLLRPARERTAYSVLDSEGYYQRQLEGAFTDMPAADPSEDDPSGFDELDLFVTGTDVDGDVYTVLDDAGHAIDVKDHRRVFVLKHRQGRREPFKPSARRAGQADEAQQALARLCRITSCFPVAFAPVVVAGPQAQDGAAARLRSWGKLPQRACAFLDGGLLDNKPFTYTVKEIFHRLADRRVERRLFYVEPDPEAFAAQADAVQPDVVQAAVAAVVGIPGYESIAEDLKLIAERNSTVNAYRRIAAAVERLVKRQGAPAPGPVYASLRLLALCRRAVQGVLKDDGHHVRLDPAERAAAEALYASFDDPDSQVWARQRAAILRDYDVYYAMRRLFKAIYTYYDHTVGAQPAQGARGGTELMFATDVLASLNRFMGELEIIRSAMEGVLDGTDFGWRELTAAEVWKRVDATLITLLDAKSGPLAQAVKSPAAAARAGVPPVPSEAALAQLDATLDARASALCRRPGGVRFPTLAAEAQAVERYFDESYCSVLRDAGARLTAYVDHLATAHGARPGIAELALAYRNFEALDAQLYPLQYAARLDEQDVIETVRISPRDAQSGFSRRAPGEKVCGDEVAHFSGFFKRSWRSNDILWGRLDGLCQLVETFFCPERIAADAVTLKRLASGDLHPDRLFPHSSPARRAQLAQWLTALGDAAHPDHAHALQRDFASRREALIEAAQLEILQEAVPEVIKDDILEQKAWNQFRTPEGYVTGAEHTGSLVAAAAAEQLARAEIERMAGDGSDEAPVARFFRSRYRVGSETVAEAIPPLVIAEFAAKAMLVTRNALFTALDKRAPGARDHPVMKAVSGALWLTYFAARWMRRSRCGARVIAAIVLVLAAVTLAYYWHHAGPSCTGERYGRWANAICANDGSYAWGVLSVSLAAALLALGIVAGWVKRLLRRRVRSA